MDFYEFCLGYMWNTHLNNGAGWMVFGAISRAVLVIVGCVGALICFIDAYTE